MSGRKLRLYKIKDVTVDDGTGNNELDLSKGGGTVSGDYVAPMKNIIKFSNTTHVYMVGDTSTGWKVNRYDIANHLMIATGVINKPGSIYACTLLSYVNP